MEMCMKIADKTLVITGANRGVGSALVEEALRRGAKRVYAGTRSPLQPTDKRVTAVSIDVTNASQVQRAASEIDAVDILINNAGIALYDDLSKPEIIEQHLAVNLLGTLRITQALLPRLRAANGAIVNVLSLAALATLPMIPAYSISKAAASSMTQSFRALLARDGVTVHAAFLGPVDTEMSRGLEVPKASPESVAKGILDGVENGHEDIFPDPASHLMEEGWRAGVVKALEHQFAAFAPR